MKTERLSIDTGRRRAVVDLTGMVERFLEGSGDGLLSVYLPHATAGLALVELGAGSEEDLADAIDRLVPREDIYRHSHGSTGHGADHVLPAFISPSLMIPVTGGRAVLGTWQRIALVDTNIDNPHREVVLSFLKG